MCLWYRERWSDFTTWWLAVTWALQGIKSEKFAYVAFWTVQICILYDWACIKEFQRLPALLMSVRHFKFGIVEQLLRIVTYLLEFVGQNHILSVDVLWIKIRNPIEDMYSLLKYIHSFVLPCCSCLFLLWEHCLHGFDKQHSDMCNLLMLDVHTSHQKVCVEFVRLYLAQSLKIFEVSLLVESVIIDVATTSWSRGALVSARWDCKRPLWSGWYLWTLVWGTSQVAHSLSFHLFIFLSQ